jgi:8-oxo-dGTP pyrophosphatase MutT (NUDIX family)
VRQPHEAIVAVLRGPELLLMHRSPDSGGYWHLVAGGLEDDETAAAAARRELREETGLDTEVRPFGWRFHYPLDEEPRRIAQFAPGTERIAVDAFVAEAPPGWEPQLNEEHDGYRWCAAAEAQALLRWPEPRELAARLLR